MLCNYKNINEKIYLKKIINSLYIKKNVIDIVFVWLG